MQELSRLELIGVDAGWRRGEPVVRGVTLTVPPGEMVALFGPSGCGKTTLLRAIAGDLEPEAGVIRIRGGEGAGEARAGYAAPTGGAPARWTVLQTIQKQASTFGVRPALRRASSLELIEALSLGAEKPFGELTGGELALLGIAGALIHRPAVLLLDGVTAALDRDQSMRLAELLRARRVREGLAILHATTVPEEAEAADRVAIMDAGCVLAVAPAEELLRQCANETLTIETLDGHVVERTLRGLYDVTLTEQRVGVRISPADGPSAAAHLYRHPVDSSQVVLVSRPTLWDVWERLR